MSEIFKSEQKSLIEQVQPVLTKSDVEAARFDETSRIGQAMSAREMLDLQLSQTGFVDYSKKKDPSVRKEEKKIEKEQLNLQDPVEKGKKEGRCWEGYKPVKGKKPYSPGSCVKKAKTPVGKKISKLIREEGMPQKQAVATALEMERRGRLTPQGEYKRVKKSELDSLYLAIKSYGEIDMELKEDYSDPRRQIEDNHGQNWHTDLGGMSEVLDEVTEIDPHHAGVYNEKESIWNKTGDRKKPNPKSIEYMIDPNKSLSQEVLFLKGVEEDMEQRVESSMSMRPRVKPKTDEIKKRSCHKSTLIFDDLMKSMGEQ